MKTPLCGLILTACLASAQALTLDFDTLTDPGTYGPSTKLGFTTQGFVFNETMDVIDIGSRDGWSQGVGGGHSGNFAAVNSYGDTFRLTRDDRQRFGVEQLWLHGWEGKAGEGVFIGWRDRQPVLSQAVRFGAPWQPVILGWQDLDALAFEAQGFLLDDLELTLSPVPEAPTAALMALGLLALAGARRVRRGAG